MRMPVPKARRKVRTNLSPRADLRARARALGLNLSEVLDSALEKAIRDAERKAWLAENEDAIDAYNTRIGRDGLFADRWRRF